MKANKSKLKSHQKRYLNFQDYSNILNKIFLLKNLILFVKCSSVKSKANQKSKFYEVIFCKKKKLKKQSKPFLSKP